MAMQSTAAQNHFHAQTQRMMEDQEIQARFARANLAHHQEEGGDEEQ